MTPSGIEPATFRFVAQYLNHCAAAVSRFFGGGRIILKCIFKKYSRGMDWIDLDQDRNKISGCCKHGDEPSGSIK